MEEMEAQQKVNNAENNDESSILLNTNFGPISGAMMSPTMLNFPMMANNPMLMSNPVFDPMSFDLVDSLKPSSSHSTMDSMDMFGGSNNGMNSFLDNFAWTEQTNHFNALDPNNLLHFGAESTFNMGMMSSLGAASALPPSVTKDEDIESEHSHERSRRGQKRKLKEEHEPVRRPRKRGRRSKSSASTPQNECTYVGIRNEFGEVKIDVRTEVVSRSEPKFEVFGYACTDKIDDILEPKKRERYVRGLDEDEKKNRRREQNRNAAARSRAKKNAMISKVIQLHQENAALRAYVSNTIKEFKELNDEKQKLLGKLGTESAAMKSEKV